MTTSKYIGWTISFRKNLHMYCHDLRASSGGTTYTIPCEDTPSGDGLVAIWPYELQMDPSTYSNLIQALHEWAANEGLSYRIYVTRERFELNQHGTNNQAEQGADGNPTSLSVIDVFP